MKLEDTIAPLDLPSLEGQVYKLQTSGQTDLHVLHPALLFGRPLLRLICLSILIACITNGENSENL